MTHGLVGVLLFLLLVLGGLLNAASYAGRWLYGAVVFCFMFLVGMILTGAAWKDVKVDWSPESQIYNGVLQDLPQEKTRSYQCRVEVGGKEVLLYLPKDSLSASLKVGDGMSFQTRIDSPKNREEFQTFDYARYLYYEGISGTVYVPAGRWRKLETRTEISWKLKALCFREKLLDKYREWGIGPDQLPVLSALTLGYKGGLDKETREAYATAGISHVLALSGMHIGIVWLFLDVLLRPFMKRRLRVLKGLVTVALLWGFAFVVGLEPSVVRAVVMCMLMELGRLSGSRALSMNTLAIAAFLMLLYHPFYLFDVGFQLSFVAVASILLFYPLIFGIFSVRHRSLRWVWGVMSVSMAAQIGTAPLVMYYFSSFSVYFLLANVLVALLVPLIIYGAILMVLSAPFHGFQVYVVKCLDGCVGWLNDMAGWIARLPSSTVSLSVLNPVEIVVFYGMLALGIMYWKTRRRRWLIRTLAACVCLLGLHLCALLLG